jgi:hypothetical protein
LEVITASLSRKLIMNSQAMKKCPPIGTIGIVGIVGRVE